MRISPADLSVQFERARKAYPVIRQTETKYHLPTYFLFAIGSRETNLTNEVGDHGHGHGMFQLDDRSHTIPPGFDHDVNAQAEYAGKMLRGLLDHYQAKGYQKRYQAAAAAYNSGTGNVDWAISHGQDPSSVTTGNDYGIDVVDRMRYLQGKYPLPDASASQPFKTYTVRAGDTLTSIAAHLGLSSWRVLYDNNRHIISNPDRVYPGQQLRYPA